MPEPQEKTELDLAKQQGNIRTGFGFQRLCLLWSVSVRVKCIFGCCWARSEGEKRIGRRVEEAEPTLLVPNLYLFYVTLDWIGLDPGLEVTGRSFPTYFREWVSEPDTCQSSLAREDIHVCSKYVEVWEEKLAWECEMGIDATHRYT